MCHSGLDMLHLDSTRVSWPLFVQHVYSQEVTHLDAKLRKDAAFAQALGQHMVTYSICLSAQFDIHMRLKSYLKAKPLNGWLSSQPIGNQRHPYLGANWQNPVFGRISTEVRAL